MMKIDLAPYETRAAAGLLARKIAGELIVYNYTDQCQFERAWDEYTTQARGLIVTADGEVVARPFPKFFNLGEPNCPALPELPYLAYEKIDGSLGLWYHFSGRWRVATRGSLENDFTAYAGGFTQLLEPFPREWTVHTEICMPRDLDGLVRAVSHAPGLYLLGAVNRDTGEDIDPLVVAQHWHGLMVQSWDKSVDHLLAEVDGLKQTEGRVVRFANGLRVKLKTAWYLRLFRAISNLSEKYVKEMALDQGDKWLAEFPEEIRSEAEAIYASIMARYNERLAGIQAAFAAHHHPDRKTFALSIKDHPERSFLFMLYDNRDIQAKLFMDC